MVIRQRPREPGAVGSATACGRTGAPQAHARLRCIEVCRLTAASRLCICSWPKTAARHCCYRPIAVTRPARRQSFARDAEAITERSMQLRRLESLR